MDRRAVLQNIFMAAGSLVTLPAWAENWEVNNLSIAGWFSSVESKMIAAVAGTIIPDGKDPGALKVGVDKFLVKLFEDCYNEDTKKNIRVGLAYADDTAKNNYARSFENCSQAEREIILLKMASSPDKPTKDFFELLKSETIRGYSTSKEVMVNYFKYKVVPGHWHGCANSNV